MPSCEFACFCIYALLCSTPAPPQTPLQAQQENLPPWRVPQSAESAVPHLVFSLMGFTSLSNCEIIQTSQSHPPCEQRVTSLSSPQSLTPRAMAGFLYSQVQSLHGPTWLVASSSSSLWVHMASNLSGIWWCVFSHLLFRIKESSHTSEVHRSWSEYLYWYHNREQDTCRPCL